MYISHKIRGFPPPDGAPPPAPPPPPARRARAAPAAPARPPPRGPPPPPRPPPPAPAAPPPRGGGGGGGRRPGGGGGPPPARRGAPAAAGFSPVPQFHFSSKRPPGHARHREAGIQFCGQPAADLRGGGRQRSTWWGYSSSTSAVRFTWPSFLGAAAAVRPISLSAFSITLAAISSASSGFCRRYSLALSRPCPRRTSP